MLAACRMKMVCKPNASGEAEYRLIPVRAGSSTDHVITLLPTEGGVQLDTQCECLQTPAVSKMVAFYYDNAATRDIPALLANILISLDDSN